MGATNTRGSGYISSLFRIGSFPLSEGQHAFQLLCNVTLQLQFKPLHVFLKSCMVQQSKYAGTSVLLPHVKNKPFVSELYSDLPKERGIMACSLEADVSALGVFWASIVGSIAGGAVPAEKFQTFVTLLSSIS